MNFGRAIGITLGGVRRQIALSPVRLGERVGAREEHHWAPKLKSTISRSASSMAPSQLRSSLR